MRNLVAETPSHAQPRILIVASRDPGGPRTGRKAVIATIIRSLETLGYPLEVAVVARREPEGLPRERGVKVHRVPLAGPLQIARNLVGFARGRLSLNEALFYSPRGAERVRAIAQATGCELVVADMIRTVPLARATRLPMIVDLDDLLSERYEWLARQGGDNATILGYYAQQLPAFVSKPAGWIAARLLRIEARTVARREVEVAREADAVSLVAAAEAGRLEERAGVPVACLPMAIRIPPTPADVRSSDPSSILFVGGLDYFPNEVAVRWFASEVASRMGDPPPFHLSVVGACPDGVRDELESPAIRFLGYVDDVTGELPRHRAFVAPMVEGTGVKTKVLEAMAAGVPVVTSSAGVRGLSLENGVHCLVADTGEEFLACLRRLADDAGLAASDRWPGPRLRGGVLLARGDREQVGPPDGHRATRGRRGAARLDGRVQRAGHPGRPRGIERLRNRAVGVSEGGLERRPLGATGLEVSALGMGCAKLGAFWQGRSPAEGRRAIDAARRAGINLFDTADCYARGISERLLGRALLAEPGDVVVCTKVGLLKTPLAVLSARRAGARGEEASSRAGSPAAGPLRAASHPAT